MISNKNDSEKLNTLNDYQNNNLMTSYKKFVSLTVTVFTIIIITILPLIFKNYYFDISKVKYEFYCLLVILMAVFVIFITFIFIIIDKAIYSLKNTKLLMSSLSIRSVKFTDIAMIAFLIAGLLSTLQSEYIYNAFWGDMGRHMGLFVIILLTISFFLITKFFKFRLCYIDIFLISGLIVCILGILHFFKIDPLGFKNNISEDYKKIFTSTIGNINSYTAFVAIIATISIILFLYAKNIYKKAWYTICLIVSLFSLITGISDNAYISLIVIWALIPLYIFNSLSGVRKYLLLSAILFSLFKFVDFISNLIPYQTSEIHGLFNLIIDYENLGLFIIELWILVILLYLIELLPFRFSFIYKKTNILRVVWILILIFMFYKALYILYDININGNVVGYGNLSNYMLFNDSWGTNRGYIWRIALDLYKKFPIYHKLFGYGPDTFGILTQKYYLDDMKNTYGVIFDNAHNEYLQYLITTGIVGLFSYIVLIFSSIIRMIKNSKDNPTIIAITLSIICYCTQAIVNINSLIVTPIMFLLLTIGLSLTNNKK